MPKFYEASFRRPGRLALLVAAVLGAHLLVLQALPAAPLVAPRTGTTTMEVRRIEPAPVIDTAPQPVATAVITAAASDTPARPKPPVLEAPVASLVAASPSPASPASPAAPVVAPIPTTTAVVAPPMRLRYDLTVHTRGIALSGQGELAWRHDGRQYEAQLTLTSLVGTRSQRSTGQITPQGLAPTRYGERSRSEEAAHFDRAAGRITFSGNHPEAALLPGAQDRLSLLLQLGALIAGDPARYRPGSTLTVQTATAREAEIWQLRVEGEEDLRLPGGPQRALRLLRLPRKEFDQKVELWLAPALAYAPVRVRLTQPGGDWLEQQWSGTDRN